MKCMRLKFKVMDLALATGCPVIGINDSGSDPGGGRLPERMGNFLPQHRLQRCHPPASVIPPHSGRRGLQPCADRTSSSWLRARTCTSPVLRSSRRSSVRKSQKPWRPDAQRQSGNAHFTAKTEDECFAQVRNSWVTFRSTTLRAPLTKRPGTPAATSALREIVPTNPNRYDTPVSKSVVGGDSLKSSPLGYHGLCRIGGSRA